VCVCVCVFTDKGNENVNYIVVLTICVHAAPGTSNFPYLVCPFATPTSKLLLHWYRQTELILIVTRGPKGPWVAHLRKRSKVRVEPFTEDH